MARISAREHVLTPLLSRNIGTQVIAAFAMAAILMVAAMPVSASPSQRSDGAKERFLVLLRDSASPTHVAEEHRRQHGAEISHVYQHALKGYAAELPEQALDGISRDPRVAFVERDQAVETTAQTTPTGVARIFAPANTTVDIDGADDMRVDVDMAIIDTGIDSDHPDLNVASITDCTISSSLGSCKDGAGEDDHGHGTHVAGTAAALDNGVGVVGVAPGARLHGIKVLSTVGSGLMSWVVAGIDVVTARSDSIEVANMSLGCDCPSNALDQALTNSVDRGIVYAVSAGNNDKDAAGYNPANHPDVITVSALADFDGAPGATGSASCTTDVDDTLANFSNWGPAIEVAAPGVCILSTSSGGGYRTMSGTSMASPHVAGAAAILASGENDPQDRVDVAAIRDVIRASGSFDWIDDSGDGSQEPLLNVGSTDVFRANGTESSPAPSPSPSPENQPPLAEFTYSCSNLACSFDATGSSDPDGTISSYSWDFGDRTTATGPTVEKAYGSSNTYSVRLDVVDDAGATSTTSQAITVSDGSSGEDQDPISLSGMGTRLYGQVTVSLRWHGTDLAGMIVVYRNGALVATTADDAEYTDTIENSSGSLTYKICEEMTTRCSNEVTLFN